MSPISLEDLANQNPKYRRALRQLQAWIDAHPEDRVLNPLKLARDIRSVNASELAYALTLLMKAGLLKRVYKVLTPAGVFADAEFDDPASIPEKLPDRFERYFETSDADVVPVFRRIA
jgi:hypothetical protein